MLKNKRAHGLIPVRRGGLMKKSPDTEDSSLLRRVFICSLRGLLISTLTGLLLITAASAIAYATEDPTAFLAPLALASLMPTMFVCGFATVKQMGHAPMLCGVVSGGMMTVLTLFLGIILRGISSSGYGFIQALVLHAFAVVFAVLGAFAGNVKRKPKRAKRRFGR